MGQHSCKHASLYINLTPGHLSLMRETQLLPAQVSSYMHMVAALTGTHATMLAENRRQELVVYQQKLLDLVLRRPSGALHPAVSRVAAVDPAHAMKQMLCCLEEALVHLAYFDWGCPRACWRKQLPLILCAVLAAVVIASFAVCAHLQVVPGPHSAFWSSP